MRRLLVALLAALAGCQVDLDDTAGKACDDEHPCRAGRFCVDGRCLDVLPEPPDAGTVPTDGGRPDAGSAPDAGKRWYQAVHGFTGRSVLEGCALEIDALRGNRVVSVIRSAADTADRATANMGATTLLPQTGQGRLRGRFQLPADLRLRGNSTWLVLSAGSAQLLTLYFTASGQLGCYSGPDTLTTTAVNATAAIDGGFVPNRDYLIEVAWQRGRFRNVWVDGVPMMQQTLNANPPAALDPDLLRLGIFRYDGTADAGWTITLTDWQIADDANAKLTD